MRAVVLADAGGPETLRFEETPTPEPGAHEIRVRVRASALNRADVLQRRGKYPAPPGWPARIPGLEYAGDVDSRGDGVTRWRVGDRVMGLVGGGGHAESVVVHEDEALAVPERLSLSEAAAIPEAFLTAFDALIVTGRLARGERALIHAVGSGVGTAAVQVAKRAGAFTIGTSRTPDKLERARELGLDLGVLTRDASFRDAVGGPVDLILDLLGAGVFSDNIAVLAPGGRMVLLGLLTGTRTDVDLEPVMRKRLQIHGSVMRTRAREERIALAERARAELMPGFVEGTLRPVVGRTYRMVEIAEAHRAMEGDEVFGKIVLEW